MQRILVLGGGFAGLWAAAGAARVRDRRDVRADRMEIVLVNRDRWHAIRVRNYEADLTDARVPLNEVLDPIGVRLIESEVTAIDPRRCEVTCNPAGTLSYDRLVFALGSRMLPPRIPAAELAFDIDTYGGAMRLAAHLNSVPDRRTIMIVGAGLTGIELATELGSRRSAHRILLVDRSDAIGSDMGPDAAPVIGSALTALGVDTRTGVSITSIDAVGAALSDGTFVAGATVVWCIGMHAHPLTAAFPVRLDERGRVPVTDTLKIAGMDAAFAAGDAARLLVDGAHASVMSCQHSRPMGRFAGHNAASDLLGQPLLPLSIPYYVTCLDLGRWGAVFTQGWNRRVVAKGEEAKRTKLIINRERIYPPRNDRAAILAAAAPEVQPAPVT